MADRRYLSGAQKRKMSEGKKKKDDDLMKSIPKLFDMGFSISRKSAESGESLVMPMESGSQSAGAEDTRSRCDSIVIESQDVNADEVEVELGSAAATGPEYGNDPGLWNIVHITDRVREYWISKGPSECQHHDSDFHASERTRENDNTRKRKFVKSLLYRNHVSGEKHCREWLLYSPSTGNVYCFVCLLFSTGSRTPFSGSGFSDWKHASERITEHERGILHRNAMLTWVSRQQTSGIIDSQLSNLFESERQYWRNVFRRVAAVIKFISERGLALRGANEVFGSSQNGNYMGMLELIGQFDPFISNHIKQFGNKGKGRASYLSSTICEEFIKLIGDKLLSVIIAEIQEAKYFSLSVDSTPDLCHVDQLTIIVRYVSMETNEVVERFLCFLPIERHTVNT